MSFRTLNNLTDGQKHGENIRKLIEEADCITIASPYLFPDFEKFLGNLEWPVEKKLHLITRIQPNSEDQIRNAKSLARLVHFAKRRGFNLCVSLNIHLHGKVYIFRKNNVFTGCVISSANFTNNGMHNFHEWGVFINDKEEIEHIYSDVMFNRSQSNISNTSILKMAESANEYEKKNRKPPKPRLNLLKAISKHDDISFLKAPKYWLKPIGITEDPIPKNELFDSKTLNLHFTVNEPTDVSPGDILIAFAVGRRRLISAYRVESKPLHDGNLSSRWPWYVEGRNLTPEFGKNWFDFNLNKEVLKNHFEQLYPGQKVKPGTDQNFGAFRFGRDRLEITPRFANFLIQSMKKKSTAL